MNAKRTSTTIRYGAVVSLRPVFAFDLVAFDCTRCQQFNEPAYVVRIIVGEGHAFHELHVCDQCARDLRALAGQPLP